MFEDDQDPPGARFTTDGQGDAAAEGQEPRTSTQREVLYLRHLIDHMVPVKVKLRGGEVVRGVIEYYDKRFIRLTRAGEPNLFIFKKDIQYLAEDSPPGATS